jgi:hypothetical protein
MLAGIVDTFCHYRNVSVVKIEILVRFGCRIFPGSFVPAVATYSQIMLKLVTIALLTPLPPIVAGWQACGLMLRHFSDCTS